MLLNQPEIVQIYIRVSSEKQEKYSPQSQRAILTEWAQKHHYLLLEPIVETGSGESIYGRPGIQRVLKLAEEKAFTILAVIEMERIARDETLQDTLLIKSILRDNGIRIATPTQMFDLQNVEDDFLSDLFSVLSKRERRKIIQRSHRGRRTAKQQGRYIGEFLTYGWTVKRETIDGKLVSSVDFDPVEKEGLEIIVKMGLENHPSRVIAAELSRLGFKTKMGNSVWNKATVLEIMRSTWLYGEAIFFRKKDKRIQGKRVPHYYPESEWVTYKVPAIITHAEWETIQKNIDSRRLSCLYTRRFEYLFQGKLRCWHCYQRALEKGIRKAVNLGTRTDWYSHKHRDGKIVKEPRYPYYLCANRARHEKGWPCEFPQLRAPVIDTRLWEETVSILRNPKILQDAVRLSTAPDNARMVEVKKELEKAKSELAKSMEERKRAMKNILVCEEFSRQEFKEIVKDIEADIERQKDHITKLEHDSTAQPPPVFPFSDLEAACKALSESLDEYTFEMKRKLVDTLYEDIFLRKDFGVIMNGRIPLDDEGICSLKSIDKEFTQDLAAEGTSGSRWKTARSRFPAPSCRCRTRRASCSRPRSIPVPAAIIPIPGTSVRAPRSRSRNTCRKSPGRFSTE
jgi:site-specific DNA recombinase